MSDKTPACVGKVDLFDPDRGDFAQAAKVCAGCPVRDWCASERDRLVKAGYIAFGVWAGMPGMRPGDMDDGRFSRAGGTRADRIAAEDALYDDEQAHSAYIAYRRDGDRTDWAKVGNRVWERRRKAIQRKAVAA